MPRDAERIGRQAGQAGAKGFDEQWEKAFAKTLDRSARASFDRWRKSGRRDSNIYTSIFNKRLVQFRSEAMKTFEGMRFGDEEFFGRMVKRFGSVEAASKSLKHQLDSLRGSFDNRSISAASAQLDQMTRRHLDAERAAERLTIAERNKADAIRRSTQALRDDVEVHTANQATWDDYVRRVGGKEEALRRVNKVLEDHRELMGGADRDYIRLNGRVMQLASANDRLARSNNVSAASFRRVERRAGAFSRMMTNLGNRIKNFGNRGDLTPRIIVGIILTLGESIATLGSGIAASLTAMISSVAVAIGGLAVMALPALAGIAGAAGLAINSFRFMREEVAEVDGAIGRLGETAEMSGRRFANAWGPSVARFLDALNEVLGDTGVIDAFAESLSRVTDAFTNVMNSPAFMAFREQLLTNIPEGLARLGEAAASIFEGLIGMAAAAAPYFNELMDSFSRWADGWAERMSNLGQDSGFATFMEKSIESVKQLMGVLDALGEFLGTIFMAGVDSGNNLLGMLEDLLRGWTDWMNTIEGQRALEEWFENGERILLAVADLLGDIGAMLAQIVTPESIDRLVTFLDNIGDLLPGLGELITLFGELDILNMVAEALALVGSFLAPLMPHLHELAAAISQVMQEGMRELGPAFERMGEAIAPLLPKITELVAEILPPLITVIADVITAIASIIDYFVQMDEMMSEVGMGSEAMRDTIIAVWDFISEKISAVVGMISGIFETLIALMKGDFSGAFKHLEGVVRNFVSWVGLDFDELMNFFQDLYRNADRALRDIGSALRTFGDWVSDVFGGVIGWLQSATDWFWSLFGAANSASSASSNARASGGGGGFQRFAMGGILAGPRHILAGEAGAEAIVPLQRPLSQVDASVRWLAAIAQGKPQPMASGGVVGGGKSVTIEAGAIVVQEAGDPMRAANEVQRRIAEDVMG